MNYINIIHKKIVELYINTSQTMVGDLEARLREEMDSKLAKIVEKLKEKFAQKL